MLNAKLKPVWSDEERGADRYRLLIEASADVAEAGTQAVSIHDLSATGFLLESDASLPVGAEISLDIPGAGTGAGDVVWTSGRFAGGQFRKPLASEVLAGARSASRVIWPDFARRTAADRTDEAAIAAIAGAAAGTAPDQRLPIGQRAAFIVGASCVLWTPIALGAWAVLA
jgi:hypothetical protein